MDLRQEFPGRGAYGLDPLSSRETGACRAHVGVLAGVLADEVFLVALDAVIALVVPFETMVLRGGELIGETGLPFLGGLGAVHP